ncbi:uncharacterized protein [Argopecten irradians]|uniref:uncharacterized protein n=1 Tax=Argopecten irradians TaxID=31199 RepID=UPI0037135250
MGKNFKQRLQDLFCSCTHKRRPGPAHVDAVVIPPIYLPQASRSYISAKSAGSIMAISGIDLTTVSHVMRPTPLVTLPQTSSLSQLLFSQPKPARRPEPEPVAVDGYQDTIIRGTICQDSVGPLFVNRQCTTMAYQALAYQAVKNQPDNWTSKDVNTIIRMAHRQHARFRLTDKISDQIDGKVGIYQLPAKYIVRTIPQFMRKKHEDAFSEVPEVTATSLSCVDGCYEYTDSVTAEALSGVSPEFPIFMENAFKVNREESVNMILTIGETSVAIWRRRNDDRLWLFDSHRRGPKGDFHYGTTETEDQGSALVRSFEDLDALMTHLTTQYGTTFQYSATLLSYDVD